MAKYKYIRWFNEIDKDDIPMVGGKGANLGELTIKGVDVPPGFCVTAPAYSDFIEKSDLQDEILDVLEGLDVDDAVQLQERSAAIRALIIRKDMPKEIEEEVISAYNEFNKKIGVEDGEVAIRSSATAEDLPDASFAGQQDTYLHISGIDEVKAHIKRCWASLWTARAIYYRHYQEFDHSQVALSVVVQKMVESKISGVMFTANPINSNKNEIMINASWGLGEAVVSGIVTPDEFVFDKEKSAITEREIADKLTMVVKRTDDVGTEEKDVREVLGESAVTEQCITDEEVLKLANYGIKIEELYNSPQDIEWALDADTNELYILQSRPITTLNEESSSKSGVDTGQGGRELKMIAKGLGASPGIGSGIVRNIKDISEMEKVQDGEILVTVMTNPDMVPAMKKAAAVVTDEGGRTCHAAIVSRELGIPCVVGAKDASESLKDGMEVTVDATRGVIYEGRVLEEKKEDKSQEASSGVGVSEALLEKITAPVTGTKIYMNLGEPDLIERYKDLPMDGIGLMRTELVFTNAVGAHPMYLLKIGEGDMFIDKFSEAVTKVAQELYPRPVTVRLSDFRTNEFRGLKGGDEVEPIEANPMIGWRGVSRYISPAYIEGFRLECKAIRKVREEYGLINVNVMLPFVRTTWELKKVKEIMAEEGLVQDNNFKIWIMAEVPSVIFEAEEFAQMVDGFSIGSNDLTQLIMGADRDSGILNDMGYFDERNEAVKNAIKTLIKAAHKYGKTVSICGQGPSTYPEFAEFLVECGIDSISVNPDTVTYTRRLVAGVEQRMILKKLRGE
ncbi:MAG: phosphoenolpyruvate synthase [Andreesenia angusta]|nr:phosphoenolpyruvate synthase [Andreesenia angusta]